MLSTVAAAPDAAPYPPPLGSLHMPPTPPVSRMTSGALGGLLGPDTSLENPMEANSEGGFSFEDDFNSTSNAANMGMLQLQEAMDSLLVERAQRNDRVEALALSRQRMSQRLAHAEQERADVLEQIMRLEQDSDMVSAMMRDSAELVAAAGVCGVLYALNCMCAACCMPCTVCVLCAVCLALYVCSTLCVDHMHVC